MLGVCALAGSRSIRAEQHLDSRPLDRRRPATRLLPDFADAVTCGTASAMQVSVIRPCESVKARAQAEA
jgi:hypothetical protein